MNTKRLLFVLLLAGLLGRILLIPIARHGDLNNNSSWGQLLLSRGPANFYEHTEWTFSAPNQPPLYLDLFGVTSFVQNSLNSTIHWANSTVGIFPSKVVWWFDTWGELYLIKLPGIFADLGIAMLIYTIIKGRKGVLLASVWLLNPVSWYNSAIWGGTDSIVNLLGLIAIYFLYRKKLQWAVMFFVMSILFKGSLLIFAPLFFIVSLKQKYSTSVWTKSLVLGLVVFLISVFPFHPFLDLPVWFYHLYLDRFLPGEIGTLTANAFNLWWLVSPLNVLDNTKFMGISARLIGILLSVCLMIPLCFRVARGKLKYSDWFAFALLSAVSFLFMTRIHERYLYPFFPLATISLAFIPGLWIPYVFLSLSQLLNLYHLFWAPGIPSLESLYNNPAFPNALSLLNIVLFSIIFVYFLHGKERS